jgi:hypothetical protein
MAPSPAAEEVELRVLTLPGLAGFLAAGATAGTTSSEAAITPTIAQAGLMRRIADSGYRRNSNTVCT